MAMPVQLPMTRQGLIHSPSPILPIFQPVATVALAAAHRVVIPPMAEYMGQLVKWPLWDVAWAHSTYTNGSPDKMEIYYHTPHFGDGSPTIARLAQVEAVGGTDITSALGQYMQFEAPALATHAQLTIALGHVDNRPRFAVWGLAYVQVPV